jgi:general secretion pathway protein C
MLRAITLRLPSSFWARWVPALATLCLWAAAAAGVAYWTLMFAGVSGPASSAPTAARSAGQEPSSSHVQKALGVAAVAPIAVVDAGSRFALSGVVAGGSGRGSALIGLDGQAPKAFKVGQTVSEGLVLHSLGTRQARLAESMQGPVTLTLDMPPLQAP